MNLVVLVVVLVVLVEERRTTTKTMNTTTTTNNTNTTAEHKYKSITPNPTVTGTTAVTITTPKIPHTGDKASLDRCG